MSHRGFAALLLAPLVLSLVACTGDDDEGGLQEPADTFVPDPDDTADDSLFDFTPTITITETGFVPLQAVAVFGETLTFVNETDRPQTITFVNGAPHVGGEQTLGPIPPGESVSVPDPLDAAISLVFESDALPGQRGRLQIDPGVDNL